MRAQEYYMAAAIDRMNRVSLDLQHNLRQEFLTYQEQALLMRVNRAFYKVGQSVLLAHRLKIDQELSNIISKNIFQYKQQDGEEKESNGVNMSRSKVQIDLRKKLDYHELEEKLPQISSVLLRILFQNVPTQDDIELCQVSFKKLNLPYLKNAIAQAIHGYQNMMIVVKQQELDRELSFKEITKGEFYEKFEDNNISLSEHNAIVHYPRKGLCNELYKLVDYFAIYSSPAQTMEITRVGAAILLANRKNPIRIIENVMIRLVLHKQIKYAAKLLPVYTALGGGSILETLRFKCSHEGELGLYQNLRETIEDYRVARRFKGVLNGDL